MYLRSYPKELEQGRQAYSRVRYRSADRDEGAGKRH